MTSGGAGSDNPYKWPNRRLREAGVIRIHELVESGRTYQQVAQALDVSPGTVFNVISGRTWPEIKALRLRPPTLTV